MIRERLTAFEQAFSSVPHTVCYSVKANSTLAILRLIAGEGAGFDVVSGGELQRVLRVDRKAARNVVFSGVGKTAVEMELALRAGILLFNVESASELKLLSATAAKIKKQASVAVRVNPEVSAKTHPYIATGLHHHKFGVPINDARQLYAEAANQPYLNVAGVSVHIGSQITDVASFRATMERVAVLVRLLRKLGHHIRFVDAGGGLGISYDGAQANFDKQVKQYARAVMDPLRNLGLHLLLEPGRSIVGPAGVLLTRVLYRKTNRRKRFLIVDAAMNDLVRPSLYGAYHEIVPAAKTPAVEARLAASLSPPNNAYKRKGQEHEGHEREGQCKEEQERERHGFSRAATRRSKAPAGAEGGTEVTDVVGPICETGDFFARDRRLPLVKEGGLLAILDVGAYGSVLASNYNTRGRPAEVLVDRKTTRTIRRRETLDDLLRIERAIPRRKGP
jgi:diaminopimelate decarboxylase